MKKPQTSTDSLDKRPKRCNTNMRFGLWNVRGFYRAGSPNDTFEGTVKKEVRFSVSA
jgi:hypothetical protein